MARDVQGGRFVRMAGAAAALAVAPLLAADGGPRLGLPWDWSHRHVVVANPDMRDPRFLARVVRKMDASGAQKRFYWTPPTHRDWSVLAGGSGGVGIAGVFPAKYNFDISAAPSCTDDFVVFPTGSAGSTSTGTTNATMSGNVTGNFGNNQNVTITNNGRTLVLTSSTVLNTGLFFSTLPTGNTAPALATKAANLAAAIDRNGDTVGVSATSTAGLVVVSSTTAGTFGNTITWTEGLGGFSRNANTMSGGLGTSGQATIVAYNQIYSSCGSSGYPSVMWSYNTGDGAVVETSPVLSMDGTQVAFVERLGGAANLVILKWSTSSPGTLDVPVAPASVAASSYRSCTAPCMTVLGLFGAPNDSNSSPYYDYIGDQLWVGAANGTVHRFTGIFNGAPTESGSPWPVTVATGRVMSSPVYDQDHDLVFVGSARESGAVPTGGKLHSVSNADGSVSTSSLLSGDLGSGSTGVADAPMLDSMAKRVYALVFTDTSTGALGCSNTFCNAIYQFVTDSPIASQNPAKARVGRGDRLSVLYSGSFDDAYYQSADPTNPSGGFYVCGSQLNEGRRPTLWKINITNNVMGTPIPGPQLVSANVTATVGHCSPITEIVNGSSEFMYLSVPANGNKTGCTGACIYAWDLSVIGSTFGTGVTAAAGLAAPGGTSGIVIDNVSSIGGASQVYFMTRGSTAGFGSVVQASQAGLN